MRRIMLVLLVWQAPVLASDVTFTSDGSIGPGDTYDNVYVYDTPPQQTSVIMTGGNVLALLPHDHSTVNVYNGSSICLGAQDSSSANVFGGEIGDLILTDSSNANIHGGEVGGLRAEAWATSTLSVYGGTLLSGFGAINSAVVNLYGGDIRQHVIGWDLSRINIYGYGFAYDPTGGAEGSLPLLTGYWLDGTRFAIRLGDTETYDHIHLLPEPATGLLSLLLLTAGPLRRRRVTQ